MAPWVAGTFGWALVFWPRLTRFVAAIFSVVALSDYLQHLYEAVKDFPRHLSSGGSNPGQ